MIYESRYLQINPDIVQADDKPVTLTGRAVVYNSRSEDLGGFREYIAPGTFTSSLQSADVIATIDHDPARMLGRSKSGTLRMLDTPSALAVEIDLPDTSYARDLVQMIRRGDVSGMSFQMYGIRDQWTAMDGVPTRTITSASIRDVSVVTFPAYPETSVAIRSLNAWLHDQRHNEIDHYRLKLAESFHRS